MYQPAQYDLVELARARDTESLINSSVERHVETAMRAGHKWESENEEVMEYMRMISDLEDKPQPVAEREVLIES